MKKFTLILSIVLSTITNAQDITRGSEIGEIYFPTFELDEYSASTEVRVYVTAKYLNGTTITVLNGGSISSYFHEKVQSSIDIIEPNWKTLVILSVSIFIGVFVTLKYFPYNISKVRYRKTKPVEECLTPEVHRFLEVEKLDEYRIKECLIIRDAFRESKEVFDLLKVGFPLSIKLSL